MPVPGPPPPPQRPFRATPGGPGTPPEIRPGPPLGCLRTSPAARFTMTGVHYSCTERAFCGHLSAKRARNAELTGEVSKNNAYNGTFLDTCHLTVTNTMARSEATKGVWGIPPPMDTRPLPPGRFERSERAVRRGGGASARLPLEVEAAKPPVGTKWRPYSPLKGGCRVATGGWI